MADLVDNLAPQVQIQFLDFSAAARFRPLSRKVRQLQRAGSLFALTQPGPPPESFRLSLLEVSAHPNKNIEGGYQWPLSAFEVSDEAQPNS